MLATCLSNQHTQVVGSFATADGALARIPELRPGAAILDIDLPGPMDGVELGLALRRQLPAIGIVLLSNHAIPRLLASLPRDAVSGWSYLLKKSVGNVAALSRAITGAIAGLVTIDSSLVADMRSRGGGVLDRLTPRQRQVLELIAQGYTNAAIAEALVLREKSVEKHVSLLYEELRLDRDSSLQPRVLAVLTYLRETRLSSPAYDASGKSNVSSAP